MGLSTYDAFGRLTGLTYPSGAAFGYGYNANGQISGVSYQPARSQAASALISQIGYQPFGPVNGWSMGNGATYARSFDQDGRISGLTLPANDTIAVTDDAASRIKALTETGLATKTFGYDKLNRLTGYASGTNTETFSYDADGNRIDAVSVTGTTKVSDIYSYDTKSNRLLKIAGTVSESVLKLAGTVVSETFGYDKSGNTTADAIAASDFVYSYDAKNRLAASANGPLSLAYGINGLGQRTSKSNTSTGSTTAARVSLAYDPPQTYFVYDGVGHLIGQYDGSGVAHQETVWLGDLPVATIQAGTAYYIAPDYLGAPHQITDPSQNVVWFWDHDPFGTTAPTGTLTYSLRFPGQFYDPLTGLNYNGFRDYDPATGRYIESDPIGLAGGVNTYGYAGGNPVSGIDPLGLWCWSTFANSFNTNFANAQSDLHTLAFHLVSAPISFGSSVFIESDASVFAATGFVRPIDAIKSILKPSIFGTIGFGALGGVQTAVSGLANFAVDAAIGGTAFFAGVEAGFALGSAGVATYDAANDNSSENCGCQ